MTMMMTVRKFWHFLIEFFQGQVKFYKLWEKVQSNHFRSWCIRDDLRFEVFSDQLSTYLFGEHRELYVYIPLIMFRRLSNNLDMSRLNVDASRSVFLCGLFWHLTVTLITLLCELNVYHHADRGHERLNEILCNS